MSEKARAANGPWTVRQVDYYLAIESKEGVVSLCRMGVEFTDAQAEANANLIAAAPDLAAACDCLFKAVVAANLAIPVEQVMSFAVAMDMATKALRKAEGGGR